MPRRTNECVAHRGEQIIEMKSQVRDIQYSMAFIYAVSKDRLHIGIEIH